MSASRLSDKNSRARQLVCSGATLPGLRFARERLMTQEINDGVGYLRSLKQSATPPAVNPAHAANPQTLAEAAPVPDSSDRFQGAEKRRSPRFKCEGSAEI